MSEHSGRVSIRSLDDCVICQKYVDLGISCDFCHGWFHNECSGLNLERISFYQKEENKEFKWYCFSCSQKFFNNNYNIEFFSGTLETRLKNLEERLHDYDSVKADLGVALNKIKDLERRLAFCEEDLLRERNTVSKLGTNQQKLASESLRTISVVKDISAGNAKAIDLVEDIISRQTKENGRFLQMQHNIDEMSVLMTKKLGGYVEPSELKCQILEEVENRVRRSRNLLLLNIAEPVESTSYRRRQADKVSANNIILSLGISPLPHIVRVHRVGKWSICKKQCRPLLIELETVHQRDRVLESVHLLDTNGSSVKIIGDYTNYQKLKGSTVISDTSVSSITGQISKNGVRPRVNRGD
jgi:hypothetical protein